jgi:hypothetical protein
LFWKHSNITESPSNLKDVNSSHKAPNFSVWKLRLMEKIPAQSKMQAIQEELCTNQTPNRLEDMIQKLIGLFYQDWIPNYELRITRWRQHIKTLRAQEATGNGSEVGSIIVWTKQDTTTMHELLHVLIAR